MDNDNELEEQQKERIANAPPVADVRAQLADLRRQLNARPPFRGVPLDQESQRQGAQADIKGDIATLKATVKGLLSLVEQLLPPITPSTEEIEERG